MIGSADEMHARRIARMRLEALAETGVWCVPEEPEEFMSAPAGSVALHVFPPDYPDQAAYIIRGDGSYPAEKLTMTGTAGVAPREEDWAAILEMPGSTHLIYRAEAPRLELVFGGKVVDVLVGVLPAQELLVRQDYAGTDYTVESRL